MIEALIFQAVVSSFSAEPICEAAPLEQHTELVDLAFHVLAFKYNLRRQDVTASNITECSDGTVGVIFGGSGARILHSTSWIVVWDHEEGVLSILHD